MNAIFNFPALLTCIILSFGCWFFIITIREFGHAIALICTKYLLCKEYKKKLELKILVAFKNGYCASPLYEHLSQNRDEKKCAIKFNAAAGYITEFLTIIIILFFERNSIRIDFKNCNAVSFIDITITTNIAIILLAILCSILKEHCNENHDFYIFNNPGSFKYPNNLGNKDSTESEDTNKSGNIDSTESEDTNKSGNKDSTESEDTNKSGNIDPDKIEHKGLLGILEYTWLGASILFSISVSLILILSNICIY